MLFFQENEQENMERIAVINIGVHRPETLSLLSNSDWQPIVKAANIRSPATSATLHFI
jgi:hypothetical protein